MISGEITSIAFGGSGILKDNGLVIFVPFTAPYDRVCVEAHSRKKNFAHGTLISLLSSGPDRINPVCPYFGICGGCQFQHLNYSAQLEAKRRFIEDALQRIGKLSISVPPVVPAPHIYQYRFHITLRMEPLSAGFHCGYTSHDNNRLVPVEQCPIFCALEDSIISHVQKIASQLDNHGIQEATVRLFKSGKQYILAFQFFPRLPNNFLDLEKQVSQDIQAILVNSPRGKHTFGTPDCHTESLGIAAAYSPYGFLQNFPEQRDTIYRAILDSTPHDAHKILDLYCGIGITSLLFAKQGKQVIGVESNPESIAIAQQNAKNNHIDNAIFYQKTVEQISASLPDSFAPDCVLCNPPREGLDPSVIKALIAKQIPHIHYLSCMPATLARDLKVFADHGYSVEKIQGFDMFPQTTHVETLSTLFLKQNLS